MIDSEEDRHLRLAGEADCAPEPLPTLRHSTAHLMAQAVTQLFPGVKVAIGPAIEDGFYYDFSRPVPFTPEDLERIETTMHELAKQDQPFVREEMPRDKAIRFFEERQEPFKVEILRGIDAPTVSFYRQGDFVDLCRGPHVASTGAIKFFKLLSSSGAYWRGSEKNPMLQRIYGTAWLTQKDLDQYLWRLEEAKKRDHRKLGRELDLFEFHDVAPGAAFWLPGGMILVRELEKFARERLDARGYQEISTPLLVNKKLWEQSGHWELYSDNMFKLEIENETFSLKPMNCPESAYVYRRTVRSYRDLPIRYSEMGRCHRNERSGTLSGLVRVRQFTQDDAHIYLRPDQVQDEITSLLHLVGEWYKTFNLEPSFRLATRPVQSLGTDAQWEQAERALHEALKANGLAYDLKPGDGTFYGPKIDIDVRDVLGRPWQLATVQVDLTMLPERMQCEYIGRTTQAAGRHPPRHLRLLRAVHRHPHRALRGRLPDVARPRPGARAAREREARRVRHGGAWAPARGGNPRGPRRPQREARLSDPRGPGAQGAVHAGGGRARGAAGHREPSPARERSVRGAAGRSDSPRHRRRDRQPVRHPHRGPLRLSAARS